MINIIRYLIGVQEVGGKIIKNQECSNALIIKLFTIKVITLEI